MASNISADEATRQILDWVNSKNDDFDSEEEDDLDDLNGPEGEDDVEFHIDGIPDLDGLDEAESDDPQNVESDGQNVESDVQNEQNEENEEQEERGGQRGQLPYRRKLLTRKRIVHSLESALDADNYDDVRYKNKKYLNMVGYLGPKSNKNTEKIKWVSKAPPETGRQRTCDVIKDRNVGGVKLDSAARTVKSILDTFMLFFTVDMFNLVVLHTNKKIDQTIENVAAHRLESDKVTYLYRTTVLEIKALFGLMYFRGLLGQGLQYSQNLFSDVCGHAAFGATMSSSRFKFLLSHLRFDDPETRQERWKTDRFAAIRELFELFNDNLSKFLVPSAFLSIDETLYPMRHQIAFRQYNPNKPHHYGLLFKSLNDATKPFTYKSVAYAGKPEAGTGPYYLEQTLDYVKYLVRKTLEHVSLIGRNISTDRLYTSIAQAIWLLKKGITSVGTMGTGRLGVPDELRKPEKDRPVYSSTCHFEEKDMDMCLFSYTVKTKSKGMKNVLMLSTMRPIHGVTKDEVKKPSIYKLYDFTKGGTDIVDQMNDFYSTRAKSLRWDMIAFYYMLDTIRVNSRTLWSETQNIDLKKIKMHSFA